ncbi:MAG: hypothetical protein ACYC7J_16505 [Syntrophales bacterium]
MDGEVFLIGIAAAILLILGVWRFSGGRYGTLRPSGKAAADYSVFLADPGLRYYTSGPDLHPNALMGVARAWSLESDLWKRRDLDHAGMKELVQGMQARAGQRLASLSGFDILDNRGVPIGTFFSPPGVDVVVRITGANRLSVSTPRADSDPAP